MDVTVVIRLFLLSPVIKHLYFECSKLCLSQSLILYVMKYEKIVNWLVIVSTMDMYI